GTAGGNANLGSLRLTSVAKLGDADGVATTLTFAAENSVLDFRAAADSATSMPMQGQLTQSVMRRWTAAGIAQANIGWRDDAYLTTGVRVERNDALGSLSTVS